MAITITVGQNPLIYTGTTPLVLANAIWYTPANVDKIYLVNPSGVGYTSGRPGISTGVTTLTAASPNAKPVGVIIVAKQPFSVDGALFGARVVSQRLSFPPGAPAYSFPITASDAEAATYDLDPANPATGLSALAYAKTTAGSSNAVNVTLPVLLSAGDTLTVTATTAANTAGFLALISQ